MSYQNDVEEFLESNPDASASEIADNVGCSKTTAGKWMKQLKEESAEGGETDENESDGRTDENESDDLDADDLGIGDDDPEDEDPDDLEPEDEDAKKYHCGGCGNELDYLQRECDNCGASPAWSAIEGDK